MAEAATDLRPAPESAPPAAPSAAPTPPPPAPETVVVPSSPSGSYIIVRDRFTLFCDRPLPALDMPNALARGLGIVIRLHPICRLYYK